MTEKPYTNENATPDLEVDICPPPNSTSRFLLLFLDL